MYLGAQEYPQTFISPVKHEIILAGSFGEIRSTHFHAGLDIKPSAKDVNDDIFCSESGYVSRIKVERGGYGRVIYIDHPNGYTTVYAHLYSFSSVLQSLVESTQRDAQSYEIDIYPEPGKYLIARGSKIGEMGNTGRSYGQHLHFEIRETRSEHPINPILFGIGPKDDVAPTIESVFIYGLSIDYTKMYQRSFSKKNIPTQIEFPAWRVGIGVEGYDQMTGATNKNGIYEMSIFVDDTLYYHQKMASVVFNQMNQIKAHVDYEEKIKNKSTIALTYRLPGNQLSIVDSIKNNGVIPLFANKARLIKIESKDLSGNTTIVNTSIIRKEISDQITKSMEQATFNLLVKYGEAAYLRASPISLSIPSNSLAKTEKLSVSTTNTEFGQVYHVGSKNIPVLSPIRLSVKLSSVDEKLILAYQDEEDLVDYGSVIVGDSIITLVSTFGDFVLIKDTIGPVIKPVLFPNSLEENYTFTIKDNIVVKGSATDFTYNVYINDVWVACEFKELINTLYIPKALINPADKLVIEAKDQKGNIGVWRSY